MRIGGQLGLKHRVVTQCSRLQRRSVTFRTKLQKKELFFTSNDCVLLELIFYISLSQCLINGINVLVYFQR